MRKIIKVKIIRTEIVRIKIRKIKGRKNCCVRLLFQITD